MAALQKMFRLYTGASMPAIGLGTCASASLLVERIPCGC